MNWYKKAQARDYPIWLAEQVKQVTDNYTRSVPIMNENFFKVIEDWVKETNPDLSNLHIMTAYNSAEEWKNIKHHRTEENVRNNNWNRAIAESQNVSPNAPSFMVDLRIKRKSIPSSPKRKINNAIHDLGNFHIEIPLQQIFKICEQNGVVPLQEDGTYWSGMLIGGAECGSEKASTQFANIHLAVKVDDQYVPANNALSLTWCKMSSGKYEVVAYVG